MTCKLCKGPVPQSAFGLGDYYSSPKPNGGSVERGPYCSEECMAEAMREDPDCR